MDSIRVIAMSLLGDVPPFGSASSLSLSADKEMDLLLKSIGESSKHSRAVLLVLLLTSLYILLSATTGRSSEIVELPVLKVSVSNQTFLAVSPVLILVLYLYLHICISDLRRRLFIFQQFNLRLKNAPFAGILVSPSILTMAFAVPRGIDRDRTRQGEMPKFLFSSLYVYAVAVFLVWIFAPLILFALWLRFIGQEQTVSLVPCAAIVVAIYGSSGGATRSRFTIILGTVVGLLLFGVSVASVPHLRAALGLGTFWTAALDVGHKLRHALGSLSSSTPITLIGATLAAQIARIFLSEEGQKSLRDYFERLWVSMQARGPISRFLSKAIFPIAQHNSPIVLLVGLAAGVIVTLLFAVHSIFQ